MENDIQSLKIKVETLENQLRGMVSKIDELEEKSSKTKHVDLVEDVGAEIEDEKVEEDLGSVITGDYRHEEEKADNKGNRKSSKQSDNKSRKSSKKNV
jgi:hypothetical protein